VETFSDVEAHKASALLQASLRSLQLCLFSPFCYSQTNVWLSVSILVCRDKYQAASQFLSHQWGWDTANPWTAPVVSPLAKHRLHLEDGVFQVLNDDGKGSTVPVVE
jgi:hypothetical protein